MTPKEIAYKMMEKDAFSQWLNIHILAIDFGYCQVEATVTSEMVNGFNIAHGGITYSLSDSAFAFASNSYGKQSVSIETSISHVKVVNVGDRLTATCKELSRGKKVGVYQVIVQNQKKETVALFKGMVHISKREWGK